MQVNFEPQLQTCHQFNKQNHILEVYGFTNHLHVETNKAENHLKSKPALNLLEIEYAINHFFW